MKGKILLTCIAVVSLLTGCGGHTHTFESTFSHDEEFHWRNATCEHKNEKADLGPHTFNEDFECTICHYKPFAEVTYCISKVEKRTVKDYLKDIVKIPTFVAELFPETLVFKKYELLYKSTDLEGTEQIMSSSLTIPYIDDEACITGFVVDSHPTLTDLDECPTHRWDKYLINCLPGNAVFQCDLMGFGTQSDKISDYHCKHLLERNTADGMLAAFDFIEDFYDISCEDLPQYNVGYSQGGYSSLAFLRYMETDATEEEKERIKIKHTYSGSGAYDINVMFNTCIEIEDFQYCHYLIKGILTTHEYHPDAYGSIKVEDYLTDYGKQFLQPLINKDNNALQAVLNAVDKDGKKLYTGPRSVFVDEYYSNPDSELRKAVTRACEYENLLDNKWLPSGELTMYYSPCDTMVTPECSKKAEKLFGELDNVEFVVADEEDHIDHQDYGTVFYVSVLLELLTDKIFDF